MADKVYINVPSIEELEEGHVSLVRLASGDFNVSSVNSVPDIIYEPLSQMYIANPVPIPDERDDADVLADWAVTGSSMIVMDRPDTGKGISLIAESLSSEWVLETEAYDAIEYGRGYYIDFMPLRPSDNDYINRPISLFWGGFSNQEDPGVPGSAVIYKHKLEVSSNESGAAVATTYEYNQDYTGATNQTEWFNLGSFNLVAKDFFNRSHRIWLQPITERRFIIKNPTTGAGAVFGIKRSSRVEVALPEEAGGGTDEVGYTWANSKFQVTGTGTAWVVLRDIEYPDSFTLLSKDYTEIGYTSTQNFEVDSRWYAPDNLGSDTAWTSALTIYNGDDNVWDGNGGSKYRWTWVITAPTDGTLPLSTKRAATIAHLKFLLDPVVQSNGLSAVDIVADSRFCLEKLRETRSQEDDKSLLSISVLGARTDFDDVDWPKLNGRCQWHIDTGVGDYIRFDGFIDEVQGSKFVDHSTSDYYIKYDVSVKSRWRDAEFSVFTGSYDLDGMEREDVYRLLGTQMGLATLTEMSIGTLTASQPLPSGEIGKEPTLKTSIGQSVLDVFKDVEEFYAVDDRLIFKDDGTGNVKLFITALSDATVGTIVRADSTQATALVVASAGGNNTPQRVIANDRQFFNDIYVIGGGVDVGEGTKTKGEVFVANYRYPPSWQDTSDPLYIRRRRLLIAINPAWNSQGLVNLVGYALFHKYVRFDVGLSIDSHLQYNIYPGDVVTLAAGGETGATNLLLRIKSISANIADGGNGLARPLSRRYPCTYETEVL